MLSLYGDTSMFLYILPLFLMQMYEQIFLDLQWGLPPDEPIPDGKYHESKMHLPSWTSQAVSPACLKRAQNTYISLELGKIISHKVHSVTPHLPTCNILKAEKQNGYLSTEWF